MPDECYFLQRLPVEIRLRIYEYLLGFDLPIKLRQIVPGSRDLAILRTSAQIYQEALPVLYDLNTIVVTRNDFCKRTDRGLKTVLQRDFARHLIVASFSRSIACTLSDADERCDVCQSSADGLIHDLTAMPRLRTVLVLYQQHIMEVTLFRQSLGYDLKIESYLAWPEYCDSFKLLGDRIGDVKILFTCGSLRQSLTSIRDW